MTEQQPIEGEKIEPKEIQVISEAIARASSRIKERRVLLDPLRDLSFDRRITDPELLELKDARESLRKRSREVQYQDILDKIGNEPQWNSRKIARWRREASFLLRRIDPHDRLNRYSSYSLPALSR